ncbi:MAG TPA: hypothetical protein VE865_07570 [Bradyrhizobium sp.]|nr:hypothetical protein [Bradyrhizobium sp.]
MAAKPEHLPESLDAGDSGGWLAEEDDLDRRSLWRLGSWGVASVAAVVAAVMASQSSLGVRREQVASSDLARHSQQIASVAKETQNEARRLASAIDTLNGDRDRLYSRVTVLEQNLDSVTGSIARQNAAPVWLQAGAAPPTVSEAQAAPQSPPAIGAAPTTIVSAPSPATPLTPAKSMMAPPDPAASKLVVPEQPPAVVTAAPAPEVLASTEGAPDPAAAKTSAEVPVQRTEFGVDLGGASSVEGLRGLWRGILASNQSWVSGLKPIIVVRERSNGLGLQLRLVAGPLSDAAAAARICAGLLESRRPCETTVFDGQRLAMNGDEPALAPRPAPKKRAPVRRVVGEAPNAQPKGPTPAADVGTR